MKKFALTALLLSAVNLSAHAGGFRHHGPFRSHHGSSVSFYFGSGSSWCSPAYSYSSYPTYSYYPSCGYPAYSYGYSYSRPNYAVGGTLLGALAGGLIGNSVHHQGWEGAGIGAAAGLVLGSVAERNARVSERISYSPPAVSFPSSSYIIDAPTVSIASTVAAAPQVSNPPPYPSSPAMSGANALFGR